MKARFPAKSARRWLPSKRSLVEQLASAPARDALEQSDLEEELAAWLNRRGHSECVETRFGAGGSRRRCAAWKNSARSFEDDILSHVLARIVSSVGAERLTREIETSTGRISELVRAIKEYTYMDQAPGTGGGRSPGYREHSHDAEIPPETRC